MACNASVARRFCARTTHDARRTLRNSQEQVRRAQPPALSPWCNDSKTKPHTRHEPAAAGTPCALNRHTAWHSSVPQNIEPPDACSAQPVHSVVSWLFGTPHTPHAPHCKNGNVYQPHRIGRCRWFPCPHVKTSLERASPARSQPRWTNPAHPIFRCRLAPWRGWLLTLCGRRCASPPPNPVLAQSCGRGPSC